MAAGINLGGTEGFEEYKTVKEIIIHENYLNGSDIYDGNLAILKLSHNIVFVQGLVNPATLPPAEIEPENGTPVTLAGWGLDAYEGTYHFFQQKLNASYINNAECKSLFGDSLKLDNGCITTLSGKGVCDGDEGGPVIADRVTIGMVSWHVGCDAYPAAIIQLGPYVDWIVAHFDT